METTLKTSKKRLINPIYVLFSSKALQKMSDILDYIS